MKLFEPYLVETFAQKLLNTQSNLAADKTFMVDAKMFVTTMDSVNEKRKRMPR